MAFVTRTVPALPGITEANRQRYLQHPATLAAGREIERSLAPLKSVEVVPPKRPARGAPRRFAAWNAERLKYHPQSAALMASVGADVWLLSEIDVGMARSGNVHTIKAVCDDECGFAFGTEFVELGLGDEREHAAHAGDTNLLGLHGNAIASHFAMESVCRIALDDGGLWFTADPDLGERRLGGRMALVAKVDGIWAASVHLESASTPSLRDQQIARLLEALDTLASGEPVILGGDLNTAALPPGAPCPFDRLADHEPLFARLAAAGFEGRTANTDHLTQRMRPDGTPVPPFRRLDWLFARGFTASSARTVPATDPQGVALSDHDIVVADFELIT